VVKNTVVGRDLLRTAELGQRGVVAALAKELDAALKMLPRIVHGRRSARGRRGFCVGPGVRRGPANAENEEQGENGSHGVYGSFSSKRRGFRVSPSDRKSVPGSVRVPSTARLLGGASVAASTRDEGNGAVTNAGTSSRLLRVRGRGVAAGAAVGSGGGGTAVVGVSLVGASVGRVTRGGVGTGDGAEARRGAAAGAGAAVTAGVARRGAASGAR